MPDMTESAPANDVLVIGAALSWEIEAVLTALSECGRGADPCQPGQWSTQLGPLRLLIYHTGIGMRAARRSTLKMFESTRAATIFNVGCAGGLNESLGSGDLVAPALVIGPAPEFTPWPATVLARQVLCEAAAAADLEVASGTLTTCRKPLLSSAEKTHYGDQHGACAVDMESAAVAAVASARGAAFVSLRAILDPVGADLPQPAAAKGPFEALAAGLLHTSLENIRSARTWLYQRRAARSLQQAHKALFSAIIGGTIDENLLRLR